MSKVLIILIIMFIILLSFLSMVNSFSVNNWFPIVPISSYNFDKPSQITILNKEFVVWKKDETFIVQDDKCPHRAAPLSEGYIDKDSGNLRCSYHGWEFDKKGCVNCIPQIYNKDSYLEKQNLKLNTYLTYCYGNILWAYLGEEMPKKTPNMIYDFEDCDENTFMRELPYDQYILLENLFDPQHIPFAHHKLQSVREKASPVKIKKLHEDENIFSLYFEDNTWNFGNNTYRNGTMNFLMPFYYFMHNKYPESNIVHALCIPVSEGNSRIFIKNQSEKKTIFNKFPSWIKHMMTNKFLDSDSLLLTKQEQTIRKYNNGSIYNPLKLYKLPTSGDSSTILFNKWASKHLSNIPYFHKTSYNNYDLDRKKILNRYEQHTKNCKDCLKTYNDINDFKIYATSILFIMGTCSGNLLILLIALANYNICEKLAEKFEYEDYVHNDID